MSFSSETTKSYDLDDHPEDTGDELNVGRFDSVENKNTDNLFTILNTNARSLCPKLNSFIDCFKEMEAHVGCDY